MIKRTCLVNDEESVEESIRKTPDFKEKLVAANSSGLRSDI